jgi:cyclopropane fatty-acyl-phospholipid synthase-like methyltransferase
VNDLFTASSAYWGDVYSPDDHTFAATVHRARQTAALGWIDELALPPASSVLEVGCGAGFLTIALAQRDLRVDAVDASEGMVDATRHRIAAAGYATTATAQVADVHRLPIEDGKYAAVVALGVVPWLHSPDVALREVARVLRPGGAVILTANNRARLNFVLDPRYNPLIVFPVKRRTKVVLRRLGWRRLGVLPDLHFRSQVDRFVAAAGLVKEKSRTVGFGPFSFLGALLFSDAWSVALHGRLQRLADAGMPLLRAAGMNYLVLARKAGAAERSSAAPR